MQHSCSRYQKTTSSLLRINNIFGGIPKIVVLGNFSETQILKFQTKLFTWFLELVKLLHTKKNIRDLSCLFSCHYLPNLYIGFKFELYLINPLFCYGENYDLQNDLEIYFSQGFRSCRINWNPLYALHTSTFNM